MDETTRRQLDKVVACTLRDAGISQPPVNVQDILDFQKLHRDFFDLEDPSVLRRFWHRVKVEGHLLVKIVKKIKLSAVWLPDEDRIIVAQDLPKPKQEWASFHDLVHCLCEWHRPFFLGDTAQTLEPEYQLLLEEEANYGASGLMFCGARFQSEARDVSLDWSGVDILCKRYGKSITTTLRRFVQWGHDHPMVMLVSTPSWKEAPEGQTERWRH
ncbi:MAG: hypothetical protein NT031_12760, partial [Planctomycetota bacterium]|nr:hypothetical protein [Planctomycetota bacterium]